jgi:FkbM family methyltransferase
MRSNAGVEISGRLQQDRQPAVRVFSRKLSTARRVFHDEGARGVVVVLKAKATPIVDLLSGRSFRIWRQREHWWVGLIVVLRGNVVRVDSCTFLVSHPAIATATKSLFLLDGYERAEREILKKYLNRSRAVIELGGSIGVVACVTNKLLTDRRQHVVVEANPDLIGALTENRDRNGCLFTILNRALAYGGNETIFYRDVAGFLGSSVQVKTERPVEVPTISLRRIIDESGFATCTLVCDIEGGEMELVRHESQVLQSHVDMIIVEIHGWRVGHDQAEEMIRTLQRIGFRCLHEKDATYVFRNERFTHVSGDGPLDR